MIWGKRWFQDADYGPYMDRLDKMLLADARRSDQYTLVSVDADDGGWFFVGVPDETLMSLFDGFTPIAESELPRIIDVLHLDAGAAAGRFKVRSDPR